MFFFLEKRCSLCVYDNYRRQKKMFRATPNTDFTPAKFTTPNPLFRTPSLQPTPNQKMKIPSWEKVLQNTKEYDMVRSADNIVKATNYVADKEDAFPAMIAADDSTGTYMVLMDKTGVVEEPDAVVVTEEVVVAAATAAPEDNNPVKMDSWMQLYLGSLTVVGLYIFFQILKKTK
jgi:hypothetical protein